MLTQLSKKNHNQFSNVILILKKKLVLNLEISDMTASSTAVIIILKYRKKRKLLPVFIQVDTFNALHSQPSAITILNAF